MPQDQTILFALFAGVFAMLLWGRWRYDLVAFCALLIALVLGVVPTEEAFAGFGHPATIIVALVLTIISSKKFTSRRSRLILDSSSLRDLFYHRQRTYPISPEVIFLL